MNHKLVKISQVPPQPRGGINQWQKVTPGLSGEQEYLIKCKMKNGSYSPPHRAFYSSEEEKFFSLESELNHPIEADVYIIIPEL